MASKKRAKTGSGVRPAAVPAAAGGVASAAAAEEDEPAKRPRIARVLSADAQQMIITCFFAVQQGKDWKGKTAENVAALLGIGHNTVKRVLVDHRMRTQAAFHAGKDPSTVRPPPDERETRNREPRVKDRHVDFVMRCLSKQMFEEDLDELPSVTSMYEYVLGQREETAKLRHCKVVDVFPFARATFHALLQNRLGYVHRAGDDEREQLKQQVHILDLRRVFLRRMQSLRTTGYVMWYLDETWVNKNTTRRKSWELGKSRVAEAAAAAGAPSMLRPKGKKKPIGKGGRGIVIGIGSRLTGVVPELLEIFKGKKSKTTDDYHKEMNATVFEDWFGKVLEWIKAKYPDQKHAIVMDNASYHSRQTDDCVTPKTNMRKDDIIQYMVTNKIVPPQLLPGYKTPEEAQALLIECIKKNVTFTYKQPKYTDGPMPTVEQYKTLTKAVLLDCIPKKEKKHVTDEMCKANGFHMVRLPPYHCEFNPIELVWAKAKAGVAKRNVTYNLKKAMEIMREETLKCDAEYWVKLEQHTMKEENTAGGGDQIILYAAELAADQPVVINFESSDEDDGSSEDEAD
jgi:hypothetical protein